MGREQGFGERRGRSIRPLVTVRIAAAMVTVRGTRARRGRRFGAPSGRGSTAGHGDGYQPSLSAQVPQRGACDARAPSCPGTSPRARSLRARTPRSGRSRAQPELATEGCRATRAPSEPIGRMIRLESASRDDGASSEWPYLRLQSLADARRQAGSSSGGLPWPGSLSNSCLVASRSLSEPSRMEEDHDS